MTRRALGACALWLTVAAALACAPQTRTRVEPQATPTPAATPSPADTPAPDRPPQLETIERAPTWLEIRAEIQRLLRSPASEWELVSAAVDAAEARARGEDQGAEVAAWRAAIAFNRAAEDAYVAAVQLVQSGQPEDYPRARELFAQVPKGAVVYPDAEAYLGWLEADALVREGARLFAEGALEEALSALAQALENPFLGPEALESVRVRAWDWASALDGLKAMDQAQTPAEERASATKVMALTKLAEHPIYRMAQRAFLIATGREVEPDEVLDALRPRFLAAPASLIQRLRELGRRRQGRRREPSQPARPAAPSRPQRQPQSSSADGERDAWDEGGWDDDWSDEPRQE